MSSDFFNCLHEPTVLSTLNYWHFWRTECWWIWVQSAFTLYDRKNLWAVSEKLDFDCFVFYAVSAIFQQFNDGYLEVLIDLWNFEDSLVALTSPLFFKIYRNSLLRAKWVVILDTGHHWTSHPTDMWVKGFCRLRTKGIRILVCFYHLCSCPKCLWNIFTNFWNFQSKQLIILLKKLFVFSLKRMF